MDTKKLAKDVQVGDVISTDEIDGYVTAVVGGPAWTQVDAVDGMGVSRRRALRNSAEVEVL